MKKLLRLGILCALLVAALCVSALAATGDNVGEKGIYGLTVENESGVTLTAGTGTGANFQATSAATYGVTFDEGSGKLKEAALAADNEYYPNAQVVKLELPAADTNQHLIFALKDSTGTPTASNILYIDQDTGTGSGNLTFYIYPSSLGNNQTYYVYGVSGSGTKTLIATFKSYGPYVVGDASGDGVVKVGDAGLILQYCVHLITESGLNIDAAEVSGDGVVKVGDAGLILQYCVHLINAFPNQ